MTIKKLKEFLAQLNGLDDYTCGVWVDDRYGSEVRDFRLPPTINHNERFVAFQGGEKDVL